jgi:hypothetical protein
MPRHWHSYVCAARSHSCCAAHQCSAGGAARALLRQQWRPHARRRCSAISRCRTAGGVSSSSSLTGAVTSCVRALSAVRMQLHELTSVDLGEYLLGKMAGSADKTAQMMARRGQLSVVGSLPDRFSDVDGAAERARRAHGRVRHSAAHHDRRCRLFGASDHAGDDSCTYWLSSSGRSASMRCNSSRAFRLAVRLLREALARRAAHHCRRLDQRSMSVCVAHSAGERRDAAARAVRRRRRSRSSVSVAADAPRDAVSSCSSCCRWKRQERRRYDCGAARCAVRLWPRSSAASSTSRQANV